MLRHRPGRVRRRRPAALGSAGRLRRRNGGRQRPRAVRRRALAPALDQERQGGELDQRADHERGRVAVDVGRPPEDGLDDDAAGSIPSASRTRGRSPAAATGSCRSGTPAGSASPRRRPSPRRSARRARPRTCRSGRARRARRHSRPFPGSMPSSACGTAGGTAERRRRRGSARRRRPPRPARRRCTPSGCPTAPAGTAAARRRCRSRRRSRTARRASSSERAGSSGRTRPTDRTGCACPSAADVTAPE